MDAERPLAVTKLAQAWTDYETRPKLLTNLVTKEKRIIFTLGEFVTTLQEWNLYMNDEYEGKTKFELLPNRQVADILYTENKKGPEQVAEESTTSSSPKKLPS